MKLKQGDNVRVKNSNDTNIYKIYGVYEHNNYSLCLLSYDDVECDNLINIKELEKVM